MIIRTCSVLWPFTIRESWPEKAKLSITVVAHTRPNLSFNYSLILESFLLYQSFILFFLVLDTTPCTPLSFRRLLEVDGRQMSSKAIVPARNGVEEDKCYPPPHASHEEVVKDPTLFWDTLRSFHSVLGTKYMVPVIGGKELNLHVLYVEVTKRGGYDKVVSEKKWREVSSVFDFSPTTTSASYALRKHYFSLLHHYEQVYFFKLQGPLLAPSGPLCFQAVGTIDGKFDCGYLVSVKLGSEILNGVLYHPELPGSSTSTILPCTAIIPYTPKPHHSGRRSRRRKGGDPSRPKPNRSGYNFFFAEKHSVLKSLYPDREREFTKMIGESWNNLNQEERVVYQNYGLKDKERYQRELKEYKERLNIRQSREEAI